MKVGIQRYNGLLKVRSHWGAATATEKLFSVVSVHIGGCQRQQQRQNACNQMGCHCRCHHKWVSNPFHDVAVDVTFAIAGDAPPCEQSNMFA